MPSPAPMPARPDSITVGELLDRCLEDAVALSVRPQTVASYRYVVRSRVAYVGVFGDERGTTRARFVLDAAGMPWQAPGRSR